ncbi:MAG TPA: hypothetical protein ENO21_03730, partial [Firmicutes bacterium]|nr:hypothetical protein [Bacillota bacterium]
MVNNNRTGVVRDGAVGALIAALLLLAGCPQPGGGDEQAGKIQELRAQAEQPSAEEVSELLGVAPFGRLAYRIYEGDGRAALDELGFTPDREERFGGRIEMGELGVFAPRTVDKLSAPATTYIEGDVAAGTGCLAYQLDGGPVIWVHADVEWLEQRLPENTDPENYYSRDT